MPVEKIQSFFPGNKTGPRIGLRTSAVDSASVGRDQIGEERHVASARVADVLELITEPLKRRRPGQLTFKMNR
jgi:hypothetical protein